jgi:hypothetical protein
MSDGITLSPEAMAQLADIGEHVFEIGHAYGRSSETYRVAVESWANAQRAIWRLLGSGGTLHSGYPLNMALTTSYGLYVAVVWFPDRDERYASDPEGDPRYGMLCVLNDSVCDHSGSNCIRHRVRVPGTWSLHS